MLSTRINFFIILFQSSFCAPGQSLSTYATPPQLVQQTLTQTMSTPTSSLSLRGRSPARFGFVRPSSPVISSTEPKGQSQPPSHANSSSGGSGSELPYQRLGGSNIRRISTESSERRTLDESNVQRMSGQPNIQRSISAPSLTRSEIAQTRPSTAPIKFARRLPNYSPEFPTREVKEALTSCLKKTDSPTNSQKRVTFKGALNPSPYYTYRGVMPTDRREPLARSLSPAALLPATTTSSLSKFYRRPNDCIKSDDKLIDGDRKKTSSASSNEPKCPLLPSHPPSTSSSSTARSGFLVPSLAALSRQIFCSRQASCHKVKQDCPRCLSPNNRSRNSGSSSGGSGRSSGGYSELDECSE